MHVLPSLLLVNLTLYGFVIKANIDYFLFVKGQKSNRGN